MPRSARRLPPLPVLIALVALLLAGGGLMVWQARQLWSGTETAPGLLADPDDPGAVAAGAPLYALHCASCHGADLEGEPDWQTRRADGRMPAPPHDDSGHTWHHPDWQLFAMTKEGLEPFAPDGYVSDMPAFDGVLRDDEILAVLAYIKSRWSPEMRRYQAQMNARHPAPGAAPGAAR